MDVREKAFSRIATRWGPYFCRGLFAPSPPRQHCSDECPLPEVLDAQMMCNIRV